MLASSNQPEEKIATWPISFQKKILDADMGDLPYKLQDAEDEMLVGEIILSVTASSGYFL